jgi:hypothetical protein
MVFTPKKIMDSVAAVETGIGHTMAVRTDGSLWMWGTSTDGQLGNGQTKGTITSPVKVMDNAMLPKRDAGATIGTSAATAPPGTNASIAMTLDGRPIQSEAPPYIENGRTLVPVRVISEALGANVAWIGDTQTVSVTAADGALITLAIGDAHMAIVEGGVRRDVVMDAAATNKDGRTYVPIRYIAEALGLEVGWDPDTQTVSFSTE